MLLVFGRPKVTAGLEVSDGGCEERVPQKHLGGQGALALISLMPFVELSLEWDKYNVRSGCSRLCKVTPVPFCCTIVPVMKLSSLCSAESPFAAVQFPSSSHWEGEEVTQKVHCPALQKSRFWPLQE